MKSWIRFSLRNAAVIMIAMLMILLGGLYSIKTMKMDQMPNVDIPYLIVEVPYVGATPAQGLEDIGKPLENSLSGISQLKNLYIESHSNVVVAILEFDMDKKMDEAEKDVTTAVTAVDLPEGAGKPNIRKDGPNAAPVFTFALSGKNVNQSDLTQYVNDVIKPQFASIDGAGNLDIYGETDKQLHVELNQDKMKKDGITLDNVKQAIQSHSFSFPAGQVDLNDKTLNVQASAELKSLDDLKSIEILSPGLNGIHKVKLSDIATVTYGNKKETVYTRLNGKPAVLVEFKAQAGANAVEVVTQAKKKLNDLTLPKGYKLTKLMDTSKEVKSSVNSMLREVLLGTLFAVIVTFLFLRNIRATIVAVLSIPLSVLASMITLKYLDYSLNIMTLAGIAVAVGRVIDDSIVVIENVYRRTLSSKHRNEQMVLSAAREVGGAVLSSTLTTMAVFGPLSFVPGIIGKFFAPFGITVIVALAFSLLVSLTVVPLLAKLFLLRIKHKEPKETWMHKTYRHVLSWTLKRRTITIVLALIFFGGSLALVPMIPKNFLPQEKAVSYRMTADLPTGTSIDKADSVAKRLEKIVNEQNHVKDIQTYVTGEHINLNIDLDDNVTKEQSDSFESDVNDKIKNIEDGVETALTPIDLTGGGNQFMLVVEGGNEADLAKAGNMIVDKIKDIDGLSNVKTNLEGTKPQLNLVVNDNKAAEKGLNPLMVAGFVHSLIAGEDIGTMQLNGKTTPINVALDHDPLHSINAINNQTMVNPMGQSVKVSDVATLSEEPGPSALYRLNQQEYVEISGRFTTNNVSGVQAEVNKRISELKLPHGVKTRSEGQSQAMNEGFVNMTLAMGIAVILVFIVMLLSFGNMIAPIAILSSLPFLFTGGLFGLYVTKQALGVPALVGFLMLIGIVVTNAIVLMDRVIKNEKRGMALTNALIEAGGVRLRPILMTALATIGALLPLAISTEGGIISKSLAIVVISGLLTSTLLTLVIVPTVYHLLKSAKNKLTKKRLTQPTKTEAAS